VWAALRPKENLQLKNLVSSIFQRLNLLPPQEGEGFLSRGAALPSSPGGMTAAVLETLERLPSVKVRCIAGWAYESHAILVWALGSNDADDGQRTNTDKAMKAIHTLHAMAAQLLTWF
jgi:hypothetical protein